MARFLRSLMVLSLFSSPYIGPAKAQSVAVQVSDLHDRPMTGVVLSVSGNGSTGAATDVAGKTQIVLPQGTQPGDSVILILVQTIPKNLIFFSPWEGRAIVPKPQGFIGVVLGARGDTAALKNSRFLVSITATITSLNRENEPGFWSLKYRTFRTFSEQAGFKPDVLDNSIREFLSQTNDPSLRKLAKDYRADYPKPMAYEMERPLEKMAQKPDKQN